MTSRNKRSERIHRIVERIMPDDGICPALQQQRYDERSRSQKHHNHEHGKRQQILSLEEENGILRPQSLPEENDTADENRIEEVIVVTQDDCEEYESRCNRYRNSRTRHQNAPAQHEQRQPLERHQIQMTFHVRKVIARKSKHETGNNAGPIALRKVVCQQECSDSACNERKNNDDVVDLSEREETQQRNGHKSVECVQRVRQ